MLYIGGGNARLIEPPLPANVKTVSNIAGITGGVRLWDGRMDHAFAKKLPAFAEKTTSSPCAALVDALADSRTVTTAVFGGYQERLRGNNAQVWRAICSSSCEARTSTEQRGAGRVLGLFAGGFR